MWFVFVAVTFLSLNSDTPDYDVFGYLFIFGEISVFVCALLFALKWGWFLLQKVIYPPTVS